MSVWLYSYSEQVSSAREIARLMEYEPGLMWLSGLGEVNYHTLADFRTRHEEALKQLLAQLLGVLSKSGLVKLDLVAQDSTKERAQAGADTFRRAGTLQAETEKAQRMMEAIEGEETGPATDQRRQAARQRAARERVERMKEAAAELRQLQDQREGREAKAEARVSLSAPSSGNEAWRRGDGSEL